MRCSSVKYPLPHSSIESLCRIKNHPSSAVINAFMYLKDFSNGIYHWSLLGFSSGKILSPRYLKIRGSLWFLIDTVSTFVMELSLRRSKQSMCSHCLFSLTNNYVFHRNLLRRTLNIKWSDKVSNKELYKRSQAEKWSENVKKKEE